MVRRLVKRALMLLAVLRHRDCAPKVVFYHDVGTRYTPMGTDARVFWEHMACLKRANAALARRSATAANGEPQVHQVCFDDGFRGIWDWREKFRETGTRPTVFVAIRLIGLSGYLTWDEIRTLQGEYGFSFQCHTWSHQTLAGGMIDESPVEERTEAWFHRELVESKRELERRLNAGAVVGERHKVDALCFPAGNFSDEVVARCKAAGYGKVYASYPGNITAEYLQPRNLVQDFGSFDFRLALAGGMMAFYGRYHSRHRG